MKTKLTPSIYKFILSLDAEDEKNSDYVVKHIGGRPKEGSDTGHLVSLAESSAESKIIVKAGITLSLVRQVTEHYLAKDDTKIEKKLGKFIAPFKLK